MKKHELEILASDRKNLWHPYDSAVDPLPVRQVTACRGVYIELAGGERLIDGISSWWCMAHGHNHPRILAAMRDQLEKFSHVMFAGLTHEPAAELGEKLTAILPGKMTKVFFADSGSIAAEVAIKMALQYQRGIGRPEKKRMMTVRGGYHGDTLGTMALGDPEGMHAIFGGMLPEAFFLPRPPELGSDGVGEYVEAVREILAEHAGETAGLMLEPVFQGGGGMRFYDPRCLTELRKLCDEFDILLICDEIATGFGRTGKFFACEHAGIAPDIICVGKALTGGAITLAATACTERVARGVSGGKPGKLIHGPTFMANPLACAAGCASLELFATGYWQESVAAIERQLHAELAEARNIGGVKDVRVLGAIGVIETESELKSCEIMLEGMKRGVFLRPFGHCIYTMPPFTIEPHELTRVTDTMKAVLKK